MTRARILAVLDPHHAQYPMASDELIEQVGGDVSETRSAIEELVRERRVMTCLIHRPCGDVVVFWPAGKVVGGHASRVQQARAALTLARAKKARK